MTFPRFTTPDGESVPINPALVAEVRTALPNEMDPRAKTVIVLSHGFQAVREPKSEVENRLGI